MNDHQLIQIVDSAMAEAGRKAGAWLKCRPGCFECCLGPFEISAVDAARLRRGLAELETRDPARASRVRTRVAAAAARLRHRYPEDTETRALASADEDDEPCPVLDPEGGTCDLYEWRPLTCRTFGPAIRGSGGAVGVCELCFPGATEEEIAGCAVELDTEKLEADLLMRFSETGPAPATLVALALP